MLCPKCGGEVKPWPWQDGGYKGVQCVPCDVRWWSDDFALAAADAEHRAVETLVEAMAFPSDADDDSDARDLVVVME